MAPSIPETLSENEKKLLESVQKGDYESCKSLLNESDVHVDCLDEHGMTPLQHSCFKGRKELCDLFLSHGADVNSNEHQQGYSALMFAALSGNAEVTQMMLLAGAKVHHINSVGRTASQMAGFVGQHQCVTAIHNFLSREELDYYTVPNGLETEPKLPPECGDSLHKLILNDNFHPVHIFRLLTSEPKLLSNSEKVCRTLDKMVEKSIRIEHTREPNDILALKMHYLSALVRRSAPVWKEKGSLDSLVRFYLKGREEDGFLEAMEKLVRLIIKEFPYHECQLLQHIVRNLGTTKIGDEPSALQLIQQALRGQQFVDTEDNCESCGTRRAPKFCSNCQSVRYCNQECQKLHWSAHKKTCKSLAEDFKKRLTLQKQAPQPAQSSNEEQTEQADKAAAEGAPLGEADPQTEQPVVVE